MNEKLAKRMRRAIRAAQEHWAVPPRRDEVEAAAAALAAMDHRRRGLSAARLEEAGLGVTDAWPRLEGRRPAPPRPRRRRPAAERDRKANLRRDARGALASRTPALERRIARRAARAAKKRRMGR